MVFAVGGIDLSKKYLKDVMVLAWKGKWIITIITAISLVLGLGYCLFIMEDVYEAQSVLSISPVQNTDNVKNVNSVPEILAYLSLSPSISVVSYLEQITMEPVLGAVIEELNLSGYSVGDLKSKISLESPNNTNLIYLKVNDSDGETAVSIANAVADEFIEYISDVFQTQAGSVIEFLSVQYNAAVKEVEKNANEFAVFLELPRGADELRGELNAILNLIKQYKIDLVKLSVNIDYYAEGLQAGEDRLLEISKTFILIKAVGDDTVLIAALSEDTGVDYSDIAEITMVEQVLNESYISLLEVINNYNLRIRMDEEKVNILNKQLIVLQNKIEIIQPELTVKQTEYNVLQKKVSTAEATRDLYLDELEKVKTRLAADIGRKSVEKIAGAANYNDVGQSKTVVMLIMLVVGVMTGAFVLLLKRGWKAE